MVDDEELLELVDMSERFISFYEYDGDNTPVVALVLAGWTKWWLVRYKN